MPKSVSAIKDILKREEKVLEKLMAALPLVAHKDSKATLRGTIKNKKADIRAYKGILKNSEKCPAVKKPAAKKPAAKKTAAKAATATASAKSKAAKSRCGKKKC